MSNESIPFRRDASWIGGIAEAPAWRARGGCHPAVPPRESQEPDATEDMTVKRLSWHIIASAHMHDLS